MLWRFHLPPNCPPNDAVVSNETVYRLIDSDKPHSNDFLSHKEKGLPQPENFPECEFGGVSVYTDIEAMTILQKRYKKMRAKKISAGNLTHDMGVCKHTPSETHKSHRTWWIPENYDPSPHFYVVESLESKQK